MAVASDCTEVRQVEKKMKETIAKINKTKSWFFEKINKIDKLLTRPIKKKREKTQIDKAGLRKNNGAEGINLPDSRLYYKATVIKTVWY